MESRPPVTYVTTAAFPSPKASAVQVMQMCAAMAEAGALVKLVARLSGQQPSSEILDYYGLLPTFQFEPRAWPRWPRAADLFQAQAILSERAPKWICYARGRDLTGPMLALARGMGSVVEIHGLPATPRERLMLGWMSRQPRARLITISEPLRDHYRQHFDIDTHLAPDGVDLKRFDPPLSRAEARARLGLGPGPWVVYVGGLYAGRGLETLFAATADLPVNVLVVGGRDDSDLAVWREKAAALGPAQVRFEGYQAPTRVPAYLFAADILAMPYGSRILTGSGEDITLWTSPLKLYEYLAAGRPIVSTDVQAVRGVLIHDSNALLGLPDDVPSLRESIRRLLHDPALAETLAANARRTANRHTWVARARTILEMMAFG